MARAWPRLKLLCVDAASRVGRPSSNRMTLHAFRGFAKHCNELAHLAIAVDASTVPPSDQSPEMTISQHSLTYLNISTSRITDALAIAPFLSGLFPNLRNISTCDNGMVDENGVNYHTEWREVETLLRKASPEAEGGNGS
ncbi:hypothetical protein K438DRAFT_1797564 [Mycena galopus ATCC 62051]|nr:hypothetical protein K438DRAFT_1797564 [Mycena galopus ATCC 62051]